MGLANKNSKGTKFKEKITNNFIRHKEEEKHVPRLHLLIINHKARRRFGSLQEILRIVTDSLKEIRT